MDIEKLYSVAAECERALEGEFARIDANACACTDKVMEAYRMAREAGVKRFGAHMMTGSCITDAEYFPFVTGLLMDIIGKVSKELGIDFEFVDLGGGLGIPYKPGEPALDLEQAARLTAEMFRRKAEEYGMRKP